MFLIRISDQLLETMTLAAIEAYCLGDGRAKADQLETHGLIWGYRRATKDQTIFYLDRGSVSVSAKMHTDWVKANPQEVDLKDFVVTRWSPHLTLLGTFHTHPYPNLETVKRLKGFEFSDGDLDCFRTPDAMWDKSGGSVVHLAMAMCKLGHVHEKTDAHWLRNNVWHYDVGNFRFWINALVGEIEDGEMITTDNKRSKAVLDLNTRFFNQAGDHIEID